MAWGGPFAACIPELVLKGGFADYVFSGEGELSWAELLDALSAESGKMPDEIYGLYCIKDGALHYNGMHPLGDLSEFPVMNFSHVDPPAYFQEYFGCKRMLHICSAKGCPNHCTFCYNPLFNLSTYRKRPLEQVFAEIEYLKNEYGMDGIYFTDELWAQTSEDLREFCGEFISRGLSDIHWGCQTTPGRFSGEEYQLMYDAGCRWLFLGVETGSSAMLKKAGKIVDYDATRKVIEDCREIGIMTICAFMLGLPGETEETLKQTVSLALELPASYYNFNYYYPLPGSPMCEKLRKEGTFVLPDTPNRIFRQRGVEKLQKCLCEAPSVDLNVVRNYFMWQSLIGSGAQNVDSEAAWKFFVKVVDEAVRSMFKHGFLNFVSQFFYDAREVLTIVFYAFCFPSIKRKYGIKPTRKKK